MLSIPNNTVTPLCDYAQGNKVQDIPNDAVMPLCGYAAMRQDDKFGASGRMTSSAFGQDVSRPQAGPEQSISCQL